MERTIQNYRQISCGCCTGRSVIVEADWGKYEGRTDRCVCWMHQNAPRGLPAIQCSQHGTRRAAGTEAYPLLP